MVTSSADLLRQLTQARVLLRQGHEVHVQDVIADPVLYTHNRYMAHTVARWGNSLAVRIPKALAEQAGLREGTAVEMTLADGALVVHVQGPVYSLDELVKGISTASRHKETSTGKPRGREVW